MKTKRFAIGFFIGFDLFIAINLLTAQSMSDCGLPAVFGFSVCADDIVRMGWPFLFRETGGFAFHEHFSGANLALDIIIGVVFAGAIGLWWAWRKQNAAK
jgi:hypothetical protein